MSDFILPEDIYALAQQSANDIAKGWETLLGMCIYMRFPPAEAEALVAAEVSKGVPEPEALWNVYNHVIKHRA